MEMNGNLTSQQAFPKSAILTSILGDTQIGSFKAIGSICTQSLLSFGKELARGNVSRFWKVSESVSKHSTSSQDSAVTAKGIYNLLYVRIRQVIFTIVSRLLNSQFFETIHHIN